MTDEALGEFARASGVATHWRDAFGVEHAVSPQSLRAVLAALDLPAETDAQFAEGRARIDAQNDVTRAPMIVALAGEPIQGIHGAFRIEREDGGVSTGFSDGALPGIDVAGYHTLHHGGRVTALAVCPPRCFGLADADAAHAWGLAVQLYSLRRDGDGGIGDFAALGDFVRSAARHGADAVAISPAHAQFSADPDRFSPYSPSSRVMLNVLHAACDGPQRDDALIDWPDATRGRLARMRARFDAIGRDAAFDAYRVARGELLQSHACFEALHADQFRRDPSKWHWRTWPAALRDPRGAAVAQFARRNARDVAFHAWLQQQADAGLAAAQGTARDAGMKIGLISDLAVGTDGGGSHAWSRQDEMLIGLAVGAPPDLLSPHGQNWGLLAFSPLGLRRHAYAAFIEMLRAALRHAGGVRIDHVMGLARLWVIPEGAAAADGAYLTFPQEDLLRLVALESWRHRAIVLGEDLGTLPHGFQERLESAGLLGLRVLWFERGADGFAPPSSWSRGAVAMTSTHDLPTVAGWWQARDLDWRARAGQMRDEPAERAERTLDHGRLWQAMRDSGAAEGDPPPETEPARAVDAAVAHVGGANCDLVLLPMEDALGQTEQPNLPGTLDEHPNWRRRMADSADTALDRPDVAARLAALASRRA